LFLIGLIVGSYRINQRYRTLQAYGPSSAPAIYTNPPHLLCHVVNRRPMCIKNDNPYRLPTSIKPHQYHLHIAPNLKDFTFQGRVETEIEVMESTSCIYLHQEELNITSYRLFEKTTGSEVAIMYVVCSWLFFF